MEWWSPGGRWTLPVVRKLTVRPFGSTRFRYRIRAAFRSMMSGWIGISLVRSGAGVLGPSENTLRLVAPVLPGGAERVWSRRLVMNFAEAEKALPSTYAELHFVDIEGQQRTNRWPRTRRISEAE